jgi:hypothetical protein
MGRNALPVDKELHLCRHGEKGLVGALKSDGCSFGSWRRVTPAINREDIYLQKLALFEGVRVTYPATYELLRASRGRFQSGMIRLWKRREISALKMAAINRCNRMIHE